MSASDRIISLEEAKQHTTDKSCWVIIHGMVYDVTEFLEEHPGGYDIILTATGRDATQDFEEIGHSNSAKQLLEKYLIGKYEGGDSKPESAAPKVADAPAPPVNPLSRILLVLLPLLLLAFLFLANSK